MNHILQPLVHDLSFLLLALVLLLVAKIALEMLCRFPVHQELLVRDNPALGVSVIGYYLGVLIIFLGANAGSHSSLVSGLIADTLWTLLGIVLLNLSRLITDTFVLRDFSSRKEILQDRNVGMGAVECGVYIGSAAIIAGAVSGDGGGLHTALPFYLLGQLSLIAYAWLYEATTRYSFKQELEKDNVACGLAYGGHLIAIGIVLGHALSGAFDGWQDGFGTWGFYTVLAYVFLLLSRWVIDVAFLPQTTLHEEIARDRNLNAGFLEGGLAIGFAAVIAAVF